jgi:hypothetical protein
MVRATEPGLRPPLRTINCSLPVDTFCRTDLALFKQAADYFAILGYMEKAFELYTLLLKRHQSDVMYRDTSYWHLVTQIVRTARRAEHVEIVRNILRPRLDEQSEHHLSQNAYFLRFIVNMFLANCSVGTTPEQKEDYEASISAAKECLRQIRVSDPCIDIATFDPDLDTSEHASWRHFIPREDRSLDLVFIRNLLRLVGTGDLVPVEEFKLAVFDPVSTDRHKNRQADVEDYLRCTPGPFEVSLDGQMNNPCVRSCLMWYARQIFELPHLPPMFFVVDVRDIMLKSTPRSGGNGLFFALWQPWRLYTDTNQAWMIQTERRMGISPCELLSLVCGCIYRVGGGWRLPNMITYFQEAVEKLILESDLSLARRVLKQYISDHTMPSPALEWPTSRLRLYKSHAINRLETTMKVRLLGLGPTTQRVAEPVLDSPRMYSPQLYSPNDPPVAVRNPDTATLISSLASTSTSFHIFKKANAAINRRLNALGRTQKGSFTESAGEESSRMSTISNSQLSDLSDRFAGSLRLSTRSLRGLPSSVLDEADMAGMI